MFPIGIIDNLEEYGTNRNFLACLVSKLWPVKSNMCLEFTFSLNSWLFELYLGTFKPTLYQIGLSELKCIFMRMTEFGQCFDIEVLFVVCYLSYGKICKWITLECFELEGWNYLWFLRITLCGVNSLFSIGLLQPPQPCYPPPL